MDDRFITWLLVAVIHGVVSCSSIPESGPGTKAETYSNPVLATDLPDPAVLQAPDGWFYAYATQSDARGTMLNIQVARSRNLVHWEHLGDALPRKPKWGTRKQVFWAPHVIFDRELKRYFMYYSAEPDDAEGKCLAVATSDVPVGPFVDAGKPMLCGDGFEHIDPMAFDDPKTGKHLLYWGSDSKPIKVQELAPDRLRFKPGSQRKDLIFPDMKSEYRLLIEGAWVIYRDGTYYLFFSGDRCCGPHARYAVMVARASDALGPFELFEGKDAPSNGAILRNNGFWLAPGHNSIVRDAEGTDWILYHAIDAARAHFEDVPQRRGSQRVMLLDRIVYENGWPRIAGDQPSTGPQKAPVLP
jgi:arabinan endo-1,5-alpha-L-arabinosidase